MSDNQTIPEAAVEAAAEFIRDASKFNPDPKYVRLVLEAAYPFMMLDAYNLGFTHGSTEPQNPYRTTP